MILSGIFRLHHGHPRLEHWVSDMLERSAGWSEFIASDLLLTCAASGMEIGLAWPYIVSFCLYFND